jgi:hypothetical protein
MRAAPQITGLKLERTALQRPAARLVTVQLITPSHPGSGAT